MAPELTERLQDPHGWKPHVWGTPRRLISDVPTGRLKPLPEEDATGLPVGGLFCIKCGRDRAKKLSDFEVYKGFNYRCDNCEEYDAWRLWNKDAEKCLRPDLVLKQDVRIFAQDVRILYGAEVNTLNNLTAGTSSSVPCAATPANNAAQSSVNSRRFNSQILEGQVHAPTRLKLTINKSNNKVSNWLRASSTSTPTSASTSNYDDDNNATMPAQPFLNDDERVEPLPEVEVARINELASGSTQSDEFTLADDTASGSTPNANSGSLSPVEAPASYQTLTATALSQLAPAQSNSQYPESEESEEDPDSDSVAERVRARCLAAQREIAGASQHNTETPNDDAELERALVEAMEIEQEAATPTTSQEVEIQPTRFEIDDLSDDDSDTERRDVEPEHDADAMDIQQEVASDATSEETENTPADSEQDQRLIYLYTIKHQVTNGDGTVGEETISCDVTSLEYAHTCVHDLINNARKALPVRYVAEEISPTNGLLNATMIYLDPSEGSVQVWIERHPKKRSLLTEQQLASPPQRFPAKSYIVICSIAHHVKPANGGLRFVYNHEPQLIGSYTNIVMANNVAYNHLSAITKPKHAKIDWVKFQTDRMREFFAEMNNCNDEKMKAAWVIEKRGQEWCWLEGDRVEIKVMEMDMEGPLN